MMLHIVARGKIGQSAEAELVARYVRRIAWPVRLTELAETGGRTPPLVATPARRVLLDERGEARSSRQLADMLGQWREDAVREVQFVIGGADGHGEAARAEADLLLSFGPATWPHLLVRAMLAEQLYRAVSILANHPYHRNN